jgi:hypothetical protein
MEGTMTKGAMVIKRKQGQGVRVGDHWIYITPDQRTFGPIAITIVADKNVEIVREELSDTKGPFFDPARYPHKIPLT